LSYQCGLVGQDGSHFFQAGFDAWKSIFTSPSLPNR
jgi:hypothetical protein